MGFRDRFLALFRRETPAIEQASRTIDLGQLTAAQVAHDLHSHLTAVMTSAGRLARLIPAGPAAEEIAQLRRSASSASALTGLLIRPWSANRQAINLNHVVAPTIGTLSHLMGSHIKVSMYLTSDPVHVLATPIELESILLILVLHARSAMPHEGTLTIDTVVASRREGDHTRYRSSDTDVVLTVTHTGAGLTTTTESGLGLTSVGYMVGELGGTLAVSTGPGAATSVTITLPIVRPPMAPRGEPAQ